MEHGFLYSAGTFTTIDAPGAVNTSLTGINNSGQILGDLYDGTGWYTFLDIGGTFAPLALPDDAYARGLNDQGQIVGQYVDAPGLHGFLYSAGTFTTIDAPGAANTVLSGINNSGQIVGMVIVPTHGFLYSAGTFTTDRCARSEHHLH